MILNEMKAMFNGQLLFDRPMHVKMVSMLRLLLVFELIMCSRLFFWMIRSFKVGVTFPGQTKVNSTS